MRKKLAMGASGVPTLPMAFGRAMIRSRRGIPRWAFIFARAWELISAIFTPWGHIVVQIPHPEQ
jgi:hypothetical protein